MIILNSFVAIPATTHCCEKTCRHTKPITTGKYQPHPPGIFQLTAGFSSLLVIDDGSPDQNGGCGKRNAGRLRWAALPKNDPANSGLGTAYISRVLNGAMERKYEYVLKLMPISP